MVVTSPTPSSVARRRLRAAGVVLSSTLGNALSVTPAVSAVFGVFLVPIALEFHWPRAQVSGAAAAVSLATAAAYPIAGWVGDRVGSRRTALIGSLALGLAILSLGLARSQPVLFYLQFAVIGAVGALPSSMIYAKLLSEWFETQRGLWMGISSGLGAGLGFTLMPLVAGASVVALGWRGSFVCIALIVLLVGVPIQFLLLTHPPARGRASGESLAGPGELDGVTLRQASRTGVFWLLMTALPIGGGVLMALVSTIFPLLTDRGLSIAVATGTLATVGLVSSVFEPTLGFLLDRSRTPRRLFPFYLASAPGLLLLLAGPASLQVVAGALIGIGIAGEFSALSFLISRYFGLKALGAISGIGFSLMLFVGSVATVAFNAVFDRTGSYRLAVLAIIPLLLWNAVAPLLMGPYRYEGGTDLAPRH